MSKAMSKSTKASKKNSGSKHPKPSSAEKKMFKKPKTPEPDYLDIVGTEDPDGKYTPYRFPFWDHDQPRFDRLKELGFQKDETGMFANPSFYHQQRILGEGGFGKVVLAQKDNQLFVVKSIPIVVEEKGTKAQKEKHERMRAMLARHEAQVLLWLREKSTEMHWPRFVEYVKDTTHYHIVTEWIPNTISLQRYLKESSKPQHSNICTIVLNCTLALKKLHAAGVVHRDLKPDNLLINPETLDVYLIDLGSAAFRFTTWKDDQYVNPHGSAAFSAPEWTKFGFAQLWNQLSSKARSKFRKVYSPWVIGEKTDAFAFGLICLQMMIPHGERAKTHWMEIVAPRVLNQGGDGRYALFDKHFALQDKIQDAKAKMTGNEYKIYYANRKLTNWVEQINHQCKYHLSIALQRDPNKRSVSIFS